MINNDELIRIWKDAFVSVSRHCASNIMKCPLQNTWDTNICVGLFTVDFKKRNEYKEAKLFYFYNKYQDCWRSSEYKPRKATSSDLLSQVCTISARSNFGLAGSYFDRNADVNQHVRVLCCSGQLRAQKCTDEPFKGSYYKSKAEMILDIPAATLVPSEGFLGPGEKVKIFIIIP